MIYPGTCRNLNLSWGKIKGQLPSLRLKVKNKFSNICGDIILRRADGFIAYNFATVVDDLSFGITEIVRGDDLRGATIYQTAIIEALEGKLLRYKFVPIFYRDDGSKMSKRNFDVGMEYFRSKGFKSEQIIGLLASSLNLVPDGSELTASELLYEQRKDETNFLKNFS